MDTVMLTKDAFGDPHSSCKRVSDLNCALIHVDPGEMGEVASHTWTLLDNEQVVPRVHDEHVVPRGHYDDEQAALRVVNLEYDSAKMRWDKRWRPDLELGQNDDEQAALRVVNLECLAITLVNLEKEVLKGLVTDNDSAKIRWDKRWRPDLELGQKGHRVMRRNIHASHFMEYDDKTKAFWCSSCCCIASLWARSLRSPCRSIATHATGNWWRS
jgi:hypothetical protein